MTVANLQFLTKELLQILTPMQEGEKHQLVMSLGYVLTSPLRLPFF